MWLVFTGLCMELTVMIYGIIVEHNNKTPLKVHYEGGILDPEFNWAFYLVLFTGVISIILGICLYIYFIYHPDQDINLLTDPYQNNLEEKPEPVYVCACCALLSISSTCSVQHEEDKIPPHRRAMSMYGAHTMKKRTPAPSAAAQARPSNERVAAYNKALDAESAQKNAAKQGDVEMLPINRMMSMSSRSADIKVDDQALALEQQHRSDGAGEALMEVHM